MTFATEEVIYRAGMTFIDHCPYPVLIFRQDLSLAAANPSARHWFGLDDTSIGQPVGSIPHGDIIKGWLENEELPSDWSPSSGVFFVPQRQIIREGAGYLLALQDVSENRKLARNQNEFIRILSHDLRTPLTYILGFASMLEQQLHTLPTQKQQHFVNKIITGVEQIMRIVENIQDAGRFDPETGFYEMIRTPIDIGDIIRRVADQHAIPATKPLLTMQLEIDNALPIILADAGMVERALSNLVDNAVKYTQDGGIIRVRAWRDDVNLVVSVQDNGLGIPAEGIERLFERHVRLHRPEFSKVKGSGLGLFIVRSVAQRHDGHAWVESTPGEGSTFYFSLPLRTL
jgi:signal transduction histidine kinase